MSAEVHPTAIVVADRATLGEGVRIGPFAIIGERCEIGDGVRDRAARGAGAQRAARPPT